MVNFPSSLDVKGTSLFPFSDLGQATLTVAVGTSDTTFTLDSTTKFSSTGGIAFIENEKILYTGKTATTLTGITRGYSSTTAAAHAANTTIQDRISGDHVNNLIDAVIAIETYLLAGGAGLNAADNETITGDWTFSGTSTFSGTADVTGTLRIPRKADPGSPVTGEVWINSSATDIEYRDNGASPATRVLATLDTTQTFTNKTLTAPVLGGSVTGTYTLAGTPTLGATLALGGNTLSGTATFSGAISFTDATSPIIAAKLGPASGQQHTLPAVTSDTIVLLAATQTLTNKTLTTPTIASFANATHTHADAAGGGTLGLSAITGGTAGSVIFRGASTLTEDNANLFWDDTNNRLGLGTTTPGNALDVLSSDNIVAKFRNSTAMGAGVEGGIALGGRSSDTGPTYVTFAEVIGGKENATDANTASYFAIKTRINGGGLTERVRITSAGNVGIGLTSPTWPLTVRRSSAGTGIAVEREDATVGAQYLDSPAISILTKRWTGAASALEEFHLIATRNSATAGDMQFHIRNDGGSDLVTVTRAGNVGIGEEAPSTKLHIAGTTVQLLLEDTSGSANDKRAEFLVQSGNAKLIARNDDQTLRTDNILVADLGSGNIGIGTSIPNRGGWSSLHRVLTLENAGADTNAATVEIVGRQEVGGIFGNIDFVNYNGAAYVEAAQIRAGREGADANASYLALYTRETGGALLEKMRLTSTGNVGIGTTTPNYSGFNVAQTIHHATGSAGLEVSTARTDATDALIGGLRAHFRSNLLAHSEVAGISFYTEGLTAQQRGGLIQFSTKANGSTTLTQRAVIDQAGNFGIGIAPTKRLHVSTADQEVAIFASTDANGGYVSFPNIGLGTMKAISGGGSDTANAGFRNNGGGFIFMAGGATEALSIDASANLRVGGVTSVGTNAARIVALSNGATNPTTSPADIIQLWGWDIVAGSTGLRVLDERGHNYVIGGESATRATFAAYTTETLNNEATWMHGAGAFPSAGTNTVAYISSKITQVDPSALKGQLSFHVNTGDSVVEAVRISDSANVGLGTTSFTNTPRLSVAVIGTAADTTTVPLALFNSGNTSIEAFTTNNNVMGVYIDQITLTATTPTKTAGNAATLYIKGGPIAGTNTAITNKYALWVDDDDARFDGGLFGAALATTATTGFWYPSSGSGAPTGVPANGNGAMYIDLTNSRIYIYFGGAWKSVTLT